MTSLRTSAREATWLTEFFDFQTASGFISRKFSKLLITVSAGVNPYFRLPSLIWEIYLRFHITSSVTPALYPPLFPMSSVRKKAADMASKGKNKVNYFRFISQGKSYTASVLLHAYDCIKFSQIRERRSIFRLNINSHF